MTERYIADIAIGKTWYRPSTHVYRWTAVDVDSISADTDTKISMSAHLCQWRPSTEIKWH